MAKRTCSIDECEGPVWARGWCSKHYYRWIRHGNPETVLKERIVDPERNFWLRVEKTSYCWNWTGALRGRYGNFYVGGRKCVQAHRFSYKIAHGQIPEGMEIDHICHNTQCVNPDHLRLASRKQNVENHSGSTSRSTSGVRGVYWRKDVQKWLARVNHNGKAIQVGHFDSKSDAEAAVIAKRNQLHTHNDKDRPARR